jgi:hypothetical protein
VKIINNIHHDLKDERSVKRWLLSHVSACGAYANVKVEVLKHGYPLIKRPKEYRLRGPNKCFAKAGNLASAERGISKRVPQPGSSH